jgi:hypothetical protein
MNAEFNWWLLIVGLGIGAGLVWLVLADVRRREDEVGKAERQFEASWIAETLRGWGRKIDPEMAEQVLELHQLYLSSLPPDEAPLEGVDEVGEPVPSEAATGSNETSASDDRRAGERSIGGVVESSDRERSQPVTGTSPTWSATAPIAKRR